MTLLEVVGIGLATGLFVNWITEKPKKSSFHYTPEGDIDEEATEAEVRSRY